MNTIALYRYSDTELKKILSSITILVDDREKKNQHILDYLKGKEVPCKGFRLNVGDYSFFVPKNDDLGINRELWFDDQFVIERKSCLDELSGNFTADRTRFENEFLRGNNIKISVMVEEGSFSDILDHKYRSQMNEKAFLASLLSFKNRYDLSLDFVKKEYAGMFVHTSCYYYLRSVLK